MTYYTCGCSFGKDSMATVLLALERGEPLDEVYYVEVMFDDSISGEVPEHRDFVYNVAIPYIEGRGIKVSVLRSDISYTDCFYKRCSEKSKYIGKLQGFPMGGRCIINDRCKVKPIKKYVRELAKQHEEIVQYVGIALDESERLARLKDGRVSLLAKYGYTESDAEQLCKRYGLLSPIYEWTSRNGCWFCPSARLSELAHVKEAHPRLWERLREMDTNKDRASDYFAWGKTFTEVDQKVDRYINTPKQIKLEV